MLLRTAPNPKRTWPLFTVVQRPAASSTRNKCNHCLASAGGVLAWELPFRLLSAVAAQISAVHALALSKIGVLNFELMLGRGLAAQARRAEPRVWLQNSSAALSPCPAQTLTDS
jgi:hypothetical protein